MISSTTPYKLAEIIRDTWPQLYRPMKPSHNQTENAYITYKYFKKWE
jgi:hypothetical protein